MKHILILAVLIPVLLKGQETCALMLGDEIDTAEFATVKGKKVNFCCGSCVKKFEENTAYYIRISPLLNKMFTEEEKKALGVDKVVVMKQERCPVYPDRLVNPNSPSVMYKGKPVYFWSSSATRRWSRSPDKYFEISRQKKLLPQFDE